MLPHYAMFDGEEIGGKRYALGGPIDDVDATTLDVLVGLGRVSSTKPALDVNRLPLTTTKAVEDMSRTELEAAAMDAMRARLGEATDDDLRRAVTAHRDATDDGGDTYAERAAAYAALKDKPLDSLKTAELEIVAAAEGADVSKARTNSDRVAAIQEKRLAA